MDWIALQLADCGFPRGRVRALGGDGSRRAAWRGSGRGASSAFVRDAIWQTGFASLPLVGDVVRTPSRLAEVDAVCDAFLTGVVTNRASRTQGRALVSASARSFDEPDLARLHDQVRGKRLAGHHAPLFGAVTAALGVARQDAQRLWMHGTLRNLLAAAVRLGSPGLTRRSRSSARPLRCSTRCSSVAASSSATRSRRWHPGWRSSPVSTITCTPGCFNPERARIMGHDTHDEHRHDAPRALRLRDYRGPSVHRRRRRPGRQRQDGAPARPLPSPARPRSAWAS